MRNSQGNYNNEETGNGKKVKGNISVGL